MGTECIDYIIADPIVIPKNMQYGYSEKIIYLPNSYQPNMSNRNISNKLLKREEVGLPEDAFIFCSFNQTYKITPEVFEGWMRILKGVKGAILWLFSNNETAIHNLKKEAALHGVDSERLFFASFMPVEERS